MTTRANGRIAGLTFLVYIAVGLGAMFLQRQAAAGETTAARLASIAAHVPQMRLGILLDLLSCWCALVLAVTLYAITRDVDADIARLLLVFRLAEGVVGAVSLPGGLGRLWLATASGANAPDPASAASIGAILFKLPGWSSVIAASFFAAGSTAFSYLLLRGRIVPAAIAWMGVAASVLILVSLPLQMVGLLEGARIFKDAMWLPMLAFELTIAVWLIVKGVALPRQRVPVHSTV
jgi:hypothetical protein